jgi:Zn-finger nucleic acid-binding protein
MTYREMPPPAPPPSCPRHPHPLAPSTSGGVSLLGCSGCHGAFLDVDAMVGLLASKALLRRHADVQLPPIPLRQRPIRGEVLACPMCRADMREIFYGDSEVRVDVCAEHGVWFDDRELHEVAHYLVYQAGLLTGSLDPEDPETRRLALHGPGAETHGEETGAALLGTVGRLLRSLFSRPPRE